MSASYSPFSLEQRVSVTLKAYCPVLIHPESFDWTEVFPVLGDEGFVRARARVESGYPNTQEKTGT